MRERESGREREKKRQREKRERERERAKEGELKDLWTSFISEGVFGCKHWKEGGGSGGDK